MINDKKTESKVFMKADSHHSGRFESAPKVLAIVLAAGQGKRMKSNLPKAAHLLKKKSLLEWVFDSLQKASISEIYSVISSSQHELLNIIDKNCGQSNTTVFKKAFQEKPLGTAHAVLVGLQEVEKNLAMKNPSNLDILVAYGDCPGVKSETFNRLIETHNSRKNHLTFIAFEAQNSFGYGRIITNNFGQFERIQEEKDCTSEEKAIKICNSGILCCSYLVMKNLLPKIDNKNSSQEYYLTDLSRLAKLKGFQVDCIIERDENQFKGINTQEQLQELEKVF